MKNTHSSKKQAWYLPLISLVLCVAMLAGTTFAWFTDNVTSGLNTIAAGVLDVELYHTNAAVADEKVEETTKLFLDKNGEAILWEPGVVSWENLRITNAGDLALNWKLSINTANENFVIDPETGTYNGLSKALKVGIVPGGVTATERADVVASVAAADWTTLSSFITNGQLLPAGEGTYEETFGIVIWWEPGENDNLWNLNNDKQLTSGDVLSIDLGIKLVASQMVYENDSFSNDYDEEASYAFSGSYSHNISVATDADGKVAVEATMGNANEVASALVPVGTKLEAGTTDMTLSVNSMEGSGANITAGAGESISSVDVHVTGLAADNTVPVKVTVKHLLPKYMNVGNYTLYHVENGTPVLMTLVTDPVAHNEYSYDPYTGDVTMTLANFCEISAAIKDERVWNGAVAQAFSGGDGSENNPFLIASADQLALMSKLVSGNRDAKATYKGKVQTVEGAQEKWWVAFADSNYKLVADLKFPGQEVTEAQEDDSLTFYPVGYWYYKEGAVDQNGTPIYEYGADFTGVFDGQGHTISGIYQNTWQMNGYYQDGYPAGSYHWKAAMGLFGAVYNATIKNLTIADFESDGEFAPTGCVAAFAGGNSVFENISLENCNPRVYNTGNGGIVGLNYNDTEGSVDNLTFRNITVDQTNKISALWGSYDVSCAGILGRLRDNDKHGDGVYNTATFENCHVAAIMDVYNDVCANYQYYQYRYCGMYVGTVDYVDTIGVDAVKAKIVSADNCFYYIGDWNQYWYCELVENSLASYTHDHQFSRLEKITSVKDIQDAAGNWTRTGNFVIPADAETDAICYHIRKDADGNFYQHKHEDAGTEVINGETILKEDRQHYHLPFNQLFTGYGWGSTAVRALNGISAENDIDSKVKFDALKSGNPVILEAGKAYKVSEIFAAKVGMDIQDESVQVLLSSPNNALKYTYTPNTSNWAEGTVSFSGSGTGRLSINDYSYCKPTSITIAVEDENHTAHCTCGGTGVGSTHEEIHGWTPWDGKSDITAGGNYYLTQDITSGTQQWIGQRGDETGANETIVINLCLNGKSIASKNRVFATGTGITINLMNCKHATSPSLLTGYGTTDDETHTKMVMAGIMLVQSETHLNIYDGITMQLLERDDKKIPPYGGIMDIAGNCVVTMYGGKMIDGKAAEKGGSVHVGAGSKFVLKGGSILNGQVTGGEAADFGGNIYLCEGASFEMTGGTLSGGKASGGGNIYVPKSATVTLSGGEIKDGVTTGEGGNILAMGGSTVKMSNGTISGGNAHGGGNILIKNSGASFEMTGGLIKDGKSIGAHGGNISLYGTASALISGGTVQDGEVYPVDGATTTDEKDKNGGNLSMSGNGTSVIIEGNASFQNGIGDRGGNIFHHSGDLTIRGNAKIIGGTALGKSYGGGGCIHQNNTVNGTFGGTAYKGSLTLSGAPTITDLCCNDIETPIIVSDLTSGASIGVSCSAKTEDMGKVFAKANKTGYASYFKSNNPYLYIVGDGTNLKFAGHGDHCVCGGNYDDHSHANTGVEWKAWDGTKPISEGGNYYLTKNITTSSQYWLNSQGTENKTEMTINLCLNGHSISSSVRAFAIAPAVTVNLMNCSATTAVVSGAGLDASQGGVIFVYGSDATVNLYGNITIQSKDAAGKQITHGGAIYNSGTFNMYGGKIIGSSVSGNGGAVYTTRAFTMYDGEIIGAAAEKGAAVYCANATYTMHNGSIIGATVGDANVANSGQGGAIFVDGTSSFTIENGEIYGGDGVNFDAYDRSLGGVAYIANGATFNMTNGTLYGSHMADGGVFYTSGSNAKINISGGTIYAGNATYGGGVAKVMAQATFTMTGGVIDGKNPERPNDTRNSGGSGGGALFLDGGIGIITGDAIIRNCTASAAGGAICVYNSTTRLTLGGTVKFENNGMGTFESHNNDSICFASTNPMTLQSDFAPESIIGISISMANNQLTMANGKFTVDGVTEEQAAAFFSVVDGYEVGYENGYLVLREVTNPEDVVE